MRIISTIVLCFGCLALTVSATASHSPSPPATGPPLGVDTPQPNFDTGSSAQPHHYIKMYRRTTGYVRPLPSAPPLPMTQPPPKGSLHRAFKMRKLPPSLLKQISEDHGKKRKWGRMMNGK